VRQVPWDNKAPLELLAKRALLARLELRVLKVFKVPWDNREFKGFKGFKALKARLGL
jgi:hypothetical protein